MKHGLILILILAGLLSCSTLQICDDDNQSYLQARFRTLVDGEIKDTTLSGLDIYILREGWLPGLLYDSTEANKILLPLDPNNEQSRFLLSMGEETDTLVIRHSSEIYLISYECGFAARFTLEDPESSQNMITNIDIIASQVDGSYEIDEEHLWIYF